MTIQKEWDLETRLINFAVRIIRVSEELPNNKTGNHIQGQILRSGMSPAANYGEAQSAESTADFIHKMKVVLKELRETRIWLKIIRKACLITPAENLKPLLDENDELIAVVFSSIRTAKAKSAKT